MLNCNIFIENLLGEILDKIPILYDSKTNLPIIDSDTEKRITQKLESLGLTVEDTIKNIYPKTIRKNLNVESLSASDEIYTTYKTKICKILDIENDEEKKTVLDNLILSQISFFKVNVNKDSIIHLQIPNYEVLILNDDTANLIINADMDNKNDFQEHLISILLDAATNKGTASEKIGLLKLLVPPETDISKFSDYFYQVELDEDLYIKDLMTIAKKYHNKFIDISKKREELYYSEWKDMDQELNRGDLIKTKDGREGFFLDKYKGLNIMFSIKNSKGKLSNPELMICEDYNIDKIKYQMIDLDLDIKKTKFKENELKNQFEQLKEGNQELIDTYKNNGSYFTNFLLYGKLKEVPKSDYYKIIDIVTDKNNNKIYILESSDSKIYKLNHSDLLNSNMDLAFDPELVSGKIPNIIINDQQYIEFFVPTNFKFSSEVDSIFELLYNNLKEGDKVKLKTGNSKTLYTIIKKNRKNIIIVNDSEDNTKQNKYIVGIHEISYIKSFLDDVSDRILDTVSKPIKIPKDISRSRYINSRYKLLGYTFHHSNNGINVIKESTENTKEYVYDLLNYQLIPNNNLEFLKPGDLIGLKTKNSKNNFYEIKFYKVLNKNANGEFFVLVLNKSDNDKNIQYKTLSSNEILNYNLYSNKKFNIMKDIHNINNTVKKENENITNFDSFIDFVSRKFGMPVKIVSNLNDNIFAYTDGKSITLNIKTKDDYDLKTHGAHELLHVILGFLRYNDIETYYTLFSSKNIKGNTFEEKEENFVDNCLKVIQGYDLFTNDKSDQENYDLIIKALSTVLRQTTTNFLTKNIESLLKETKDNKFTFGNYANEINSSIPLLSVMDNIEYKCLN